MASIFAQARESIKRLYGPRQPKALTLEEMVGLEVIGCKRTQYDTTLFFEHDGIEYYMQLRPVNYDGAKIIRVDPVKNGFNKIHFSNGTDLDVPVKTNEAKK